MWYQQTFTVPSSVAVINNVPTSPNLSYTLKTVWSTQGKNCLSGLISAVSLEVCDFKLLCRKYCWYLQREHGQLCVRNGNWIFFKLTILHKHFCKLVTQLLIVPVFNAKKARLNFWAWYCSSYCCVEEALQRFKSACLEELDISPIYLECQMKML